MLSEDSSYKRLHTVWLHPYEVQEQVKLIVQRSQDSGQLREVAACVQGGNVRRTLMEFWKWWPVAWSRWSYPKVDTWKKPSIWSYTLQCLLSLLLGKGRAHVLLREASTDSNPRATRFFRRPAVYQNVLLRGLICEIWRIALILCQLWECERKQRISHEVSYSPRDTHRTGKLGIAL